MVIDRTITLVAGSTPQSFTMNLPHPGAKIRGILVDNGNNAGVQVSIYRGVTIGVDAPYVVLPGYLRAIPYRETDRITVTFSGSPATVGTIYIAISSDPFVACDTAVVQATLSGPVAISGTVTTKSDGTPVPITASTPVPVDASAGGAVAVSEIAGTVAISAAGVLTVKGNQGTSGNSIAVQPGVGATDFPIKTGTAGAIKTDGSAVTQPISAAATLPNQAVSDYPSGAAPIQLSGNALFAAGILTLGSIVPGAGKSFYIVTLALKGLESQRIVWNISGQSSGQAPHGCGDGTFVFHPAFVMAFTGVTLHLQLNTSDTPIGSMNVEYIVSGYCV